MNTSTITPTAIDAFVPVEWVKVVGRHRKDLGDLTGLMASIDDVGLLNPVTLTRDAQLVAGERRLVACRRLGWDTVPVRFADSVDDAAKLLRAERDENIERKEMLPSEKASLGAALEGIESERARDRQREGQERGRAVRQGLVSSLPGGVQASDDARARETASVVGDALGMSRSTYHDLSFAHRVSNDETRDEDERVLARSALDAMDSGQGIQPTVTRLRRALNAKRDAQAAPPPAPEPEPEPEPTQGARDWVPPPRDGSPRAVARRRELIESLAGQGFSSYQISDRIGISDSRIRGIARDHNIRLPDDAMGRGTRKKIDSNRIVRETVRMFNGLEMSLRLVTFDELDPGEIPDWTASLTEAIRALNRLNKQLRERERVQ